jgi:hypothetical protein
MDSSARHKDSRRLGGKLIDMAKLDFKEIPPADKPTGRQDAFELFARDALETFGFAILLDPSRGADGGKDLIVEEHRVGPLSDTRFKWLVSCKHYAHSGSSVTPDDERNVIERVKAAGCHGFLGFYSTLPSTGLRNLIGSLKDIEVKLLDHEEVERRLLETSNGRHLIQRFFPDSYNRLKPIPPTLYTGMKPICCENCGKDLFNPPSGIWVLWHTNDKEQIKGDHLVDMYFACKDNCDRKLRQAVRMRHSSKGFIYDRWDDVPDILVPTVFITKVMALVNGLAQGDTYEPDALDKIKRLLLTAFPYVSRNLTSEDEQTLERLQRIPSYLGGLDYDN